VSSGWQRSQEPALPSTRSIVRSDYDMMKLHRLKSKAKLLPDVNSISSNWRADRSRSRFRSPRYWRKEEKSEKGRVLPAPGKSLGRVARIKISPRSRGLHHRAAIEKLGGAPMLISNGLGWERNAGTRCGRDCDGVVAGSRHISKVRRRKNRGIPRFSRISFVQLIRSDIPELDARSSRRAFAFESWPTVRSSSPSPSLSLSLSLSLSQRDLPFYGRFSACSRWVQVGLTSSFGEDKAIPLARWFASERRERRRSLETST